MIRLISCVVGGFIRLKRVLCKHNLMGQTWIELYSCFQPRPNFSQYFVRQGRWVYCIYIWYPLQLTFLFLCYHWQVMIGFTNDTQDCTNPDALAYNASCHVITTMWPRYLTCELQEDCDLDIMGLSLHRCGDSGADSNFAIVEYTCLAGESRKSRSIPYLTHWGRDKMAAIFQTTFSNTFSWMKTCKFWLRFHWSLFPKVQIAILNRWFRWWLGAGQATSHYLSQWWLDYRRIYASLGLNELTDGTTDI